MHASASEFTYLRKLNREHWLRAWPHICISPQLWTGTSAQGHVHRLAGAHARTHTHIRMQTCAVNSWVVFAVRAAPSLSAPSRTMTRALVCVCTAPSSNSARFRPLRHSSALWGLPLWGRTQKPGKRLGCRSQKKKKIWTQGPSSLRNQLEFEKSTWYTASWLSYSFFFFILCGKFKMFLHSNQGQRDISQVLFHVQDKSSQNRGLLLERSW